MPKYIVWVPAYCSVKVTLETDEDLSALSPEELKDKVVEEGDDEGGLCWQCSDTMNYDPGSFDLDNLENCGVEVEE